MWVWQVKLCDPSLTRAIPERLRDELLIIKRYAKRHFTLPFLRPFVWDYPGELVPES